VEGRPLDEAELIERAREGDFGAYEVLVRTHSSIAQRTAYVITGDHAEADDAAQQGFIKAYYALGRFRSGHPFRPWLLKIVANEARNRRRSSGRRAGLALRVAEDRRREGAAPSPEAAVLSHENAERLVRALNELREEERLVVTYRYLLDLNEAEAAAALGWPKGTVKSRLSRALTKLRDVLEAPDA
jgi:RNA polymerase sigma factor (sigma-70 family)